MRNDFEKAMHFRHACKIFDTAKTISEEDLTFILDAGRMSPSSFGVEQWHFFIIRDKALREAIQKEAWNQPQITTASELIGIAYKKKVRSTDAYIQKEFEMLQFPEVVRNIYRDWNDHLSDETLECWSARQTYIAAANMMTAAASIGIDSCPIEGFNRDAVEKILNLDTENYGLPQLMPFGYRVKPQQARHRSKLEELITYI